MYMFIGSVVDPDPDVFGPPLIHHYLYGSGSGSGSFLHKVKIVRKT